VVVIYGGGLKRAAASFFIPLRFTGVQDSAHIVSIDRSEEIFSANENLRGRRFPDEVKEFS